MQATSMPVKRKCRPGGRHHFDAAEMIARLYADDGAFVLSYVTGLLRDRYLAEDVVQETMIRAWQHCSEFSVDKGSVRGWLMRVAHNIAMDKVRMRRSRPAEIAGGSAPEALATEDHSDALLTALQVRHALARLSPGHRDVLEQVYLTGSATTTRTGYCTGTRRRSITAPAPGGPPTSTRPPPSRSRCRPGAAIRRRQSSRRYSIRPLARSWAIPLSTAARPSNCLSP
jgi:RNA polymerase sigma factor (sigma-70 family)